LGSVDRGFRLRNEKFSNAKSKKRKRSEALSASRSHAIEPARDLEVEFIPVEQRQVSENRPLSRIFSSAQQRGAMGLILVALPVSISGKCVPCR
jgi:hypothetical protein